MRLLRSLPLVAAMLAMFPGGAARAADAITIIAAFHLSGPAAVLDGPCYDGARLAAEAINARGGIDGRRIALVPVDTESAPDAVAAKVAAALAAHPDAVAGIGYSNSQEALAAGRVFQARGLPFVSPGATDPSVPAAVGGLMFYAAYGDDAQAAAMARFARERLGLARVAVWIDGRDLYTRTVGGDFASSFTAGGGAVPVLQSDDGPDGFAAFIARVGTVSPPVGGLYVASMPEAAPDLIAAARAAGIGVPLLSGDGWDAATVAARSAADSLADIYFTTHVFLGGDAPATRAFVADYSRRFGAPPPNAFAALGFDTVELVADALRRAGSADPDALRAALAATAGFEGVTGRIGYPPGLRVPRKDVSIIALADGVETLRWVAPAD